MRFGFGVWCVGLCLLLSGAAVAQSWTAFSPEGGRYRVDMPGAPRVSTAPIPVGAGQMVPMTEAEARRAAGLCLDCGWAMSPTSPLTSTIPSALPAPRRPS